MSIEQYDGSDFDLSVDVAVVGGGACGLTAAIAAAREGAETVVLEADATCAGTTAMSIGLIAAAGTKLQQEAGIEDTPDKFVADILAATRGETDPEHARFLAEASGPVIDWLTDEVGCKLRHEPNWAGYGHKTLRCHGTPNNSGEELIAMLLEAANDAGATVLTQSRASALIVDDEHNVRGVRFSSPDGDQVIGCKALVLASSGFGANRALVSKHIPAMAEALYHGCENHQGDALSWGEALGGETGDLGSYQGIGTLTKFGLNLPHLVLIRGGFMVNSSGRRFMHELDNLSGHGALIAAQEDGRAWMIYDQGSHEANSSSFREYRDFGALLEGGSRFDNVASMSAKTGIDEAGIVATLAQVSSLRESGEVDKFGRSFADSLPLEPPFFAVEVRGALFHTQGGLCIDRTARVKRAGGGVFPNLFAGGGAARSVSGPAEWGYLPAIGLATAVVFGAVAGREAGRLA